MRNKLAAIVILLAALLLIQSAALAMPVSFFPQNAAFPSSVQEESEPDLTPFYAQTLRRSLFAIGMFQLGANASPTNLRPLAGAVIGIDPGHQAKENNTLEPVAPGSSRTKFAMSAGCIGATSGTEEHEIDLAVSLKLKKLLEKAGAEVVLTRLSADVDLSNIERAALMERADVDLWIRVHCNYAQSARTDGFCILVPTRLANPAVYARSLILGRCIDAAFAKATGADKRAFSFLSDQTGFNWSAQPVVTVEMGYLSNAQEDRRLNRSYYQQDCAEGIYNGIVSYYSKIN